MIAILSIIAGLVLAALGWHHVVNLLWADTLLTHMFVFAIMDRLAIPLLGVFYTPIITPILQVILSLSIINHTFGAFMWLAESERGLTLYDSGKDFIMGLEVIGLIIYAIFRGGSGGRRVAIPPRLANTISHMGRASYLQPNQEDVGRIP